MITLSLGALLKVRRELHMQNQTQEGEEEEGEEAA